MVRTVIRALFEGAPLARIDAIGELSDVQRYRLFPPKCQCGSDHGKYARNLLRCYRGLSASARKAGEEIELSLTEWIRLAAVQGITAEETGRLQLIQVATCAFGGSPPEPSVDSRDSAELSADETAA